MNNDPLKTLRESVEQWQETDQMPLNQVLPRAGLHAALSGQPIPTRIQDAARSLQSQASSAAALPALDDGYEDLLISALSRCADQLENSSGADLAHSIANIQAWSCLLARIQPAPTEAVLVYQLILEQRAESARLDADGVNELENWKATYPLAPEDRIAAVDTILTGIEYDFSTALLTAALRKSTSPSTRINSPTPVIRTTRWNHPLTMRPRTLLAAGDASQGTAAPWVYSCAPLGIEVEVTGDGKVVEVKDIPEDVRVITVHISGAEFKAGKSSTKSTSRWFSPDDFSLPDEIDHPEPSITLLTSDGIIPMQIRRKQG